MWWDCSNNAITNFLLILAVKQFKNRLIFDEVIRHTKHGVSFFGPPRTVTVAQRRCVLQKLRVRKTLQFSDGQRQMSTKEIMGSQKFTFGPKFPQNL